MCQWKNDWRIVFSYDTQRYHEKNRNYIPCIELVIRNTRRRRNVDATVNKKNSISRK